RGPLHAGRGRAGGVGASAGDAVAGDGSAGRGPARGRRDGRLLRRLVGGDGPLALGVLLAGPCGHRVRVALRRLAAAARGRAGGAPALRSETVAGGARARAELRGALSGLSDVLLRAVARLLLAPRLLPRPLRPLAGRGRLFGDGLCAGGDSR